jgi:RNA recognition motif-containing protein
VNIFVGNLDYGTTEDQLQDAFAQYGRVDRVNIMTDRDTGQPRGFAFVEMPDSREAKTAMGNNREGFVSRRAPRCLQILRYAHRIRMSR